jgi:hypothetical protein
MPKKIENKLREGQTSKIYFYAFPKPITGYKLAQIVTGESRPFTARVYTTLTSMRNEKLITKREHGFQSNPQPLVEEIGKQFEERGISITENDKLCILGILQNDFFKELLSTISQKKTPREIDTVREISYILAVTSIVPYQRRRIVEENILRKMTPEERADWIGYIDQDIKAHQGSTDSMSEFLHYLQPNLAKKLIKLLPVDLENLWNIMEQAQQKIEKEYQQKMKKKVQESARASRKTY